MQNSRIDGLCFGDSNTKFFHTMTLVIRRRNKKKMLKNEEGNWVEDATKLKDMAVDYYVRLFKSMAWDGVKLVSGAFPRIGDDLIEAMV